MWGAGGGEGEGDREGIKGRREKNWEGGRKMERE